MVGRLCKWDVSLLLVSWQCLGLREGGILDKLAYYVTRIKFLKEVFLYIFFLYISVPLFESFKMLIASLLILAGNIFFLY